MAKLFIKTHGCQMNVYDSDKMADVLNTAKNLELTTDESEADVILLNTCSIREKAQEKVFSQLGRWRKLKNKKPNIIIGVGGCVASQEGADIIKRAPYVDIVFGPQTLHRLPEMLAEVQAKHKPVVDISFPEIEKFDNLPEARSTGPTAYLSIMEGCSKYCSFCVVPYTRGKEVSRPFEDVLLEAATLVEQGVREINLLGQNVNAYRGKMGETAEYADLALLISTLAEINNLDRIRYTTSHPVEFSDRLIEVYGEVPKLVDHLHLPVQSGSDRILALMKRGHTVLEYKAKIRRLRAIRPNISLSSDFIIGFPGETDQDFAHTMRLIEDINYDHSFSFIYSKRPGTPAASLEDDVPLDIKKQRLNILQTRILQSANLISENMVNTVQTILVDSKAKKNQTTELSGRTENNRIVNFVGPVELIGQFVKIKITENLPNCLKGQLTSDCSFARIS
ncbi:MAG: tRNA (N6-isopentenyl adenosine(37)-C2)-methylthiotransferase MiaB [Gammaproteobacteria bacterium]|nr:tRNA (N6-isopentenyl adenosine(37)-C2)-methylthiotransferase MiaB [Gammaproteobacteria bacterium]